MAASGAKETVTYDLVKSGDWKIDDIKFEGESAATAERRAPGAPGAARAEAAACRSRPSTCRRRRPDNGTRVHIKIRVTGFSVKPDGDAYRMDLAEDLETIGPDGQRLPALSRMGLETLRERTVPGHRRSRRVREHAHPDRRAAPGAYVARLTIRDHVGQNLKTHEVRFDLPDPRRRVRRPRLIRFLRARLDSPSRADGSAPREGRAPRRHLLGRRPPLHLSRSTTCAAGAPARDARATIRWRSTSTFTGRSSPISKASATTRSASPGRTGTAPASTASGCCGGSVPATTAGARRDSQALSATRK